MTEEEKRKKIEKLKKQIDKVQSEHNYAKAMQLALKLVINGSYGAFCHPAFSAANSDIANAITANAREVINYMLDNIEQYFYSLWHKDSEIHKLIGECYICENNDEYYLVRNDGLLIDPWGRKTDVDSTGLNKLLYAYKLSSSDFIESDRESFTKNNKIYNVVHKVKICDFDSVKPINSKYVVEPIPTSKDYDKSKGVRSCPIIIYGDTDSCHRTSSVDMDSGKFTIEELYNKNTIDAGSTLKGHESVECKDKILNWNKEKGLYYGDIKRIIRHKVTKPKWKIKTKSGKEIMVTNDHSMVVFRDGNQLKIKACEILKTDKILVVL